MSVNLCIDWGNSSIKAAIFENDTLQKQFSFAPDLALERVSSIMDLYSPEKAILSSVTNNNEQLTHLVRTKIKSLVIVDASTPLPINNAYGSGDTLGADRIALVTGAHMAFPDKNNLVISLGTCITYNLMQKTRTFRGGAISPGMNMRFKAMSEFTAQLPEVNADGEVLLVGYDTETCMRSGVVNGMAAEIDGMIAAYELQYADFNAILTGGDAAYFASKIKSKIFADPDLLLKGLNLILNYNVPVPR